MSRPDALPLNPMPRRLVAPVWFWLGGLGAGSYLVGLLLDRVSPDPGDALRLGALVGAVAVTLGAGLLTAELSKPTRMWRLLVVFKWMSPLSVGAWILTSFSACAVFIAADRLLALNLPGLGILELIAGALAVGLAGYTGLLLIISSRPIWNASILPGPLFVTLALASGAAVHILFGGPVDPRVLTALAWLSAGVAILLGAWLLSVRQAVGNDHPRWHQLVLGRLGHLLWVGLLLGGLLPVALILGPDAREGSAYSTVAALAALAGGLLLRYALFNSDLEKR